MISPERITIMVVVGVITTTFFKNIKNKYLGDDKNEKNRKR
jgi:hypothetical protein